MAATRQANPTYYGGDLRRDLLDAALRTIAREGPSAVSLRSLARDLGVSHAAPANHFPDKAALFTAIAVEGFTLLGQAMAAATELGPDATAGQRFRAAGPGPGAPEAPAGRRSARPGRRRCGRSRRRSCGPRTRPG